MKTRDLERLYRSRHDTVLVPAAQKLEAQLIQRLWACKRIDRITARAKGLDSFLNKANKMEGRRKKYADPVAEITDQIGARVIVLFQEDVDVIALSLLRYYQRAEETRK